MYFEEWEVRGERSNFSPKNCFLRIIVGGIKDSCASSIADLGYKTVHRKVFCVRCKLKLQEATIIKVYKIVNFIQLKHKVILHNGQFCVGFQRCAYNFVLGRELGRIKGPLRLTPSN